MADRFAECTAASCGDSADRVCENAEYQERQWRRNSFDRQHCGQAYGQSG